MGFVYSYYLFQIAILILLVMQFVAVMYFTRKLLLGKPRPPKLLAEIRAISLSIQFMLFWMPVFVIIGVCTNKHLMLVFGMGECHYSADHYS